VDDFFLIKSHTLHQPIRLLQCHQNFHQNSNWLPLMPPSKRTHNNRVSVSTSHIPNIRGLKSISKSAHSCLPLQKHLNLLVL
jgi:hypothetical protein